MALPVNEYTVMLYRELLRAKVVEADRLPPVLPVVLYNGEYRWAPVPKDLSYTLDDLNHLTTPPCLTLA